MSATKDEDIRTRKMARVRADRLPRTARDLKKYGSCTLHVHNHTMEMSINKDCLHVLGWKASDRVVYRIAGDTLVVKKLEV